MKSIKISVLFLVFLLALVACQNPQKQVQQVQIVAGKTNDFTLKLYTDNSVYSTDEAIKIWATLEYVGDENSITIWHGDPYIVFSITD